MKARAFKEVQDVKNSPLGFLKGMKLISVKLRKSKQGFKFHRHKKNTYVALQVANGEELEELLKIAIEFKNLVQSAVVKKREG